MGQCTSKRKKIRRENEPIYEEPKYLEMRAYNPNNETSSIDDDMTLPKYLEMKHCTNKNESSSNDDDMSLLDIGNAYAVSRRLSPALSTRHAADSNESSRRDKSNTSSTASNETSRRDESKTPSTDSAYSDETSEERRNRKIATKTNVKPLKNSAPFFENSRRLGHDLESMVEIFRGEIEETVDPRRILPHLTFISRSDEDELLHAWNESSVLSMKKLIDKIKALKEEGKWEAFVIALEQEGYKCIVQDLRGELQEDYMENRELIRIFASPLIKQINTYEIAQHLYLKNIISSSDKEVIERDCYNYGRIQGARTLLQRLPHGCSKWFEQFCDTLKECGHHDLLELLRPETTESTGQNPHEGYSSSFYLTPIFGEPKAADNEIHQSLSLESLDKTLNRIRRKEEKLKTENGLLESIKELNITIAELYENINGPSYRGQEERQGKTTDREKQVDICIEMRDLIAGLRASFAEEMKSIHKELAAIKSQMESLKGQWVPPSHSRRWLYNSGNDPVSSSGYNSSSYYVAASSSLDANF